MRRCLEVFRFEVAVHLRRASTWAAFAILALLGVVLVHATGTDMGVHVNAPASIVLLTFILGMLGVLPTAALLADAGTRDAATRMDALLYTTPLRQREYLAGRYLGALAVAALVLLAAPLGLAAAMLLPPRDTATVGPFRPASYVVAYVAFVLPGLLVNSAILFAIAALSRRAIATWLGVVALYAGYAAAVAVSSELVRRELGAVLDPTGITAVLELLRDWSPAERNTHPVALEGRLLVNRAIWGTVAVAILACTAARFRFRHDAIHGGRRTRPEDDREPAPVAPHVPVARAGAPRRFGAGVRWRQTLAVAHRSLAEIVAGREFQLLAAGLTVGAVAIGGDSLMDRFGTPTLPTAGIVARFLTGGLFSVPMVLVAIFYAGELVWRERDVRVADIVDASPVAEWAPLAGKFLALAGALAILQGGLLLAGVALQLLRGWHRHELGLLAQILFGLQFVDYLLFAALALLVHVLADHKHVGHLVGALLFAATRFAGILGLRHNLLVYAGDAGWRHSDLAGFGPYLEPFAWMKAYWVGWALLLGVLASLLWVRGRDTGVRHRLRLARTRATPRVLAVAVPGAVLVLGAGGRVLHDTTIRNAYETPERAGARMAEYERRYGALADRPQPKIAHVALQVELFPERRRAEARGEYVLVNRSGAPIDSVVVYLRQRFVPRALELDRPARPVTVDPVHETWIWALERPLAPGETVRLRFDLAYEPAGFLNEGAVVVVARNGTFIEREWFPHVGYQRGAELEDAARRRDQRLGARVPLPPATDSAGLRRVGSTGDADLITFDVVIGTAPDQIAASAGEKVREWTAGGRRWFHYRSPRPTANTWAVLSARYAVRERTTPDGFRVQLLHHPTHDVNADRILAAAERSLTHYGRAFGPSPYRELRIAEFPGYSQRASALPNLIAHSESFGFVSDVDDAAGDVDTPLLVTAHEVAHQWWGGQVMPAAVLGRQVLSETLANYSAMSVLEQAHGPQAVERFRGLQLIEYLNRRGRGDQPLLTTGDVDDVHYRKGAVVMWTLRTYLGQARVDSALRALLARHAFRGPPYPTSNDLLRELRAVTPDSLAWLLRDLVETITIWDLRTSAARAEPLGGGRHRVTLAIEAAKFRVDSLGRDTPTPMDDLVEVAVFGEGEGRAPLYRALHRLRAGTSTIVVEVAGVPTRAGVDPRQLLVARRGDDLEDNVRDVVVGAR